jgi:hypothetical protein
VLQMFFPSFVEYEDVIQIYNHKRVCEWLQDIIHHPHECFRALVKPKGMTNHSKRPSLDLKVVFHTSICSIGPGGSLTSDQSY